MFEIKSKTKITVKLYGEEFHLSKPTVEQVELLQSDSDMKGKTTKQKFEMICDVLDILGLPKDFSKKMEIDHLVKLIQYISGALNSDKKKEPEAGL